jgi:hypothetical protein
VNPLFPPLHLHQGGKPVQPPHEAAGYQGPQEPDAAHAGCPLAEEKNYITRYFELGRVKKVIAASKCGDMNGEEPFKCDACDCDLPLRRRLTGPPSATHCSAESAVSRQ